MLKHSDLYEVVKSAPLTQEQAQNFAAAMHDEHFVKEGAAELVEALLDRLAYRRRLEWDALARLLGYDSLKEVEARCQTLRVDYATLTVSTERHRPRPEPDAEAILMAAKESLAVAGHFEQADALRHLIVRLKDDERRGE